MAKDHKKFDRRTVFSTQCQQLVEQYEPLLIQLLLQTLDPDFVCMVRSPSESLFVSSAETVFCTYF